LPGSVVGAARLVREHCFLLAWWKSFDALRTADPSLRLG